VLSILLATALAQDDGYANDFQTGRGDGRDAAKDDLGLIWAGLGTGAAAGLVGLPCTCFGSATICVLGAGTSALVPPPNPYAGWSQEGHSQAYLDGYTEGYNGRVRLRRAAGASIGGTIATAGIFALYVVLYDATY